MKTIILLCLMFQTHFCFAEVEQDPVAGATTAEFDESQLSKKYTDVPDMSEDSADQKKIDKAGEEVEKKFSKSVLSRTEKIYRCGKLPTESQIASCKAELVKAEKN